MLTPMIILPIVEKRSRYGQQCPLYDSAIYSNYHPEERAIGIRPADEAAEYFSLQSMGEGQYQAS